MPAEVLSYFVKHNNLQLRLEFQIVRQCAPLFKRLKVANAISVNEELCSRLEELLDGMKISWRILSRREGKCLVLLYRPEELSEYLSRPEQRKILREFGYPCGNLSDMLEYLCKRTQSLGDRKCGFPHELGVFLGYPAEDVIGFIENAGKKCLFTGYWKVYHNPSLARKTFKEYDQAIECAVNEFISGKSIYEIMEEE